jgi:hypothetical protein
MLCSGEDPVSSAEIEDWEDNRVIYSSSGKSEGNWKESIPRTPLSSLDGALLNSEYEEHGLGIPKRKAEGP